MAIKTFTGATNTLWSNANNWSPPGVPAYGDAVIFGAHANPCALDGSTNTLISFDMTGWSGLFSGATNIQINIGVLANTSGAVYFNASAAQTSGWSGRISIGCTSNSSSYFLPPLSTIGDYCYFGNSGADTTGNIFFLGPFTMTASRSTTFYSGNFYFDGITSDSGFTHNFAIFSADGDSRTKTLYIGNATMRALNSFRLRTATNLTIPAHTGKIVLTGTNPWFACSTLAGASKHFNRIDISGLNGYCDGTFTCGTFVVTGTASKLESFQFRTSAGTGTKSITSLVLIGNSAINRMLVSSETYGLPRTLTVVGSSCSANGVDFKDIAFVSASNVDFSAAALYTGDCGGNSLTGGGTLSFTPAATRICTGTTANWSTAAIWTGGIVPIAQDTVICNMTANNYINADMPRLGSNLSFLGGKLSLEANGTVYDSINLTNCAQFFNTNYTLTLEEKTRTGTFPVTSNGIVFLPHLTANLSGSVLHLVDNLATSGNITINSGTVDASGHNASINALKYSQLAGALAMGSGEWKMRGTGTPWSINPGVTSLDAGTSTILFTGTTAAGTLVFAGGGKTYNNFSFYGKATGTIQVSGNNTFANLTMDSAQREATTLKLPDSGTTTFTSQANGFNNSTSLLTFSNLANTTLVKTGGGVVNCDFLRIPSLCTASPGGTWNIGDNSIANSSGTTVLGWMAPSIGTWFNI